jgi:hypothetical protein
MFFPKLMEVITFTKFGPMCVSRSPNLSGKLGIHEYTSLGRSCKPHLILAKYKGSKSYLGGHLGGAMGIIGTA